MRRVTVRVGRKTLTYSAPDDIKVGDRVELPWWQEGDGDGALFGEVVALDSNYTGTVRPIVRVLPEAK
jgi:hypothetical protein